MAIGEIADLSKNQGNQRIAYWTSVLLILLNILLHLM